MSKPLLSIGMIIKNEMRCLERCLESLAPLRAQIPCQLVIADTGSTDGSRALAERYADILVDYPWNQDFATARNAVLERCTGVWYLTVDADEWLDADISQLVTFLHSEEAKCNDEARVIQRNYADRDLEEYTDFFAARMGRMRDGKLRYFAPIHEYLGYTDRPFAKTIALPRVILHHDGYLEMTPGAVAAKQKRNMVLLRRELERDPTNLRTLKHCIDSAESPAERRRMVERCRQELARQTEDNPLHAGMYQTCARVYWGDEELDALAECLDEWHRRVPDSALYRVDGAFLRASLCYQKDQYAQALEQIQTYEAGIADVDSGADLRCPDRLNAMYAYASPSSRQRMNTIRFHCLCRLERYGEADAFLQDPSLLEMAPRQKGGLVLKVLEFWPQLRQATAFLQAVWDRASEDLAQARKSREYEVCRGWAEDLATMFREHYEKHGDPVLGCFAEMGDRAPGCSARILMTDEPGQLRAQWEPVREWKWIFPQAYLHTLELGVALPEGFYRQNREDLALVAAGLARSGDMKMARITARCLTAQPAPQTLGELVWQLGIVTAALRVRGWDRDVRLGEQLCSAYLALSQMYQTNVWAPEVLCAEEIGYLPAMTRCGWYCGQAMACLEQGDELGYVRALRSALEAAPAMRALVDFLLSHKPKTQAQRQLEELAAQVRAVLAHYPPDDPAVAALKGSEAYRKVAWILDQEDSAAAGAPEEPAAPEEERAFAALGDLCRFSSREQARKTMTECFQNLPAENRQRLAGYWQRFPLWGDGTDQVLDHAAQAFCGHWADFAWVYGRLMDRRSRQTMLAVLRAWRSFEPIPREVIDTRYDDYFDREILRCGEEDVVADLGAYTGDTFLSYVKNYGDNGYRRYYCYEVAPNSYRALQRTTESYPLVICRHKGAGAGPGMMALDAQSEASASKLSQGELPDAETVEVVALDDDIREPLTLIKMDIEGAEQSALRGCARHIREDRPKLALSVYHNFEDLWKLPRMIEELVPGYRFYLRYHGGTGWPSEITLLALPPVEQ